MCENVLEIKGLCKSLSGKQILKNIDLTLKQGEIFGFLGANGAGKTTLIKTMLGLLKYNEGSVKICGYEVRSEFEKALSNVGGIVENPEMYKYLSGRNNLKVFAKMQKGIPKSRIDEVAEIVGLQNRINDKVNRYSLGMRQRLGIAQALLNYPKLIVLDEPTNGLDPKGIKDLRELLIRLAKEQWVTVFVSSHLLSELEHICDRVAIIRKGEIINTLTISEIHSMREKAGEYLINASYPKEAAEIAREMGLPCRFDEDKLFITARSEDIPKYAEQLVLRKIGIEGIIPMEKTLEEFFMETAGDSGDKVGEEGNI